jgi:hypothetical protein
MQRADGNPVALREAFQIPTTTIAGSPATISDVPTA